MTNIKVIIPAYNEADSIAHVIHEIPAIVSEIIVVNNNSSDETATTAEKAGATVLTETKMSYFLLDIKSKFIFLKYRYFNA